MRRSAEFKFDVSGRLRRIRADNAREHAKEINLDHMDRDDLVELYLRCVQALASRPVEE